MSKVWGQKGRGYEGGEEVREKEGEGYRDGE